MQYICHKDFAAARAERDRLLALFGAELPMELAVGGDPGVEAIGYSKGIGRMRDQPRTELDEFRAITEQFVVIAEKIRKGAAWVAEAEAKQPNHPDLPARKAKVEEWETQCARLEDDQAGMIHRYIAAQPGGRLTLARRLTPEQWEDPAHEQKRVTFSIAPLKNWPYPVWTPSQIAAALRIAQLMEPNVIDPGLLYQDPLQFLADHSEDDPAAAFVAAPKRANAARRTERQPGGLLTVTPKETKQEGAFGRL